MKIVTTFFPQKEIMTKLEEKFPTETFLCFRTIKEALPAIKEAEVIITYGEDLTDEIIDDAKKLKWIMVVSAGLERMPFEAIKRKGILVTNARGIHKIPMAEYTISMMLQYAKKQLSMYEMQKEHRWGKREMKTIELNGQSLLILGVGAIGTEIARLAKAFRMNVIGINRSGRTNEYIDEMVSFEESKSVLGRADFVVSVLPSTKETKYLLTEAHFEVMKESAVFINIGRGDVVREQVLLDALTKKQCSHAILDVFEEEPLPVDHPFWDRSDITITPHISSITKHYQPRAFDIFERNLQSYLSHSNDYINVIELDRGY